MTMAAGYATGEDYQRADDSSFYDRWFNGTSSACPNACSVIALYLQSNRGATQTVVRDWLKTTGSKTIGLSDPYSGVDDTGYWTVDYNATYDADLEQINHIMFVVMEIYGDSRQSII